MTLPSLGERSTPILAEELKRLQEVATEVDSLAREYKMSPAFAPTLEKLYQAISAIDEELKGR